jgi:hypothetical protein
MRLQTCLYSRTSGWINQPDSSLDSDNTLILCFGSADFAEVESAFSHLHEVFSQASIVGCSTAGEIFQGDVYDGSLSVAIIQLEKTPVSLVSVTLEDGADSLAAGQQLAGQLETDSLRFVLVLSDGLAVNGSRLIEGLGGKLPDDVIITGGLAADGDRFEKTWIWNNGTVGYDNICAVGFYGDHIGIGHGSRGGWDMLGPEREVTRSRDNVLYEVDGQPALQLYKRYLGELADDLPASGLRFPLAISHPEDGVEDTVRTILAVDEDADSITFAGDIPQGAYVRLMRANFERLIDGAADAALAVDTTGYASGPMVAISISCVGRRLVLGPRCDEEIDAALGGFPDGTRQVGFYSYGEISPLASGQCDLHNQTMTITLLWETLVDESSL